MPNQTASGLPYPAYGDPPNVPADLQALAEALDVRATVLDPATITAVSLAAAFPLGLSMMNLSGTAGSAGGWPLEAGSGFLFVVKPAADRCAQFLFRNSTAAVWVGYRLVNTAASPWYGAAGAHRLAAGEVSVTIASGSSTAAVAVTLPTSRFSLAPLITASADSNSILAAGGTSPTATAFTLAVRNVTGSTAGGTYSVRWQAAQMTSSAAAG